MIDDTEEEPTCSEHENMPNGIVKFQSIGRPRHQPKCVDATATKDTFRLRCTPQAKSTGDENKSEG